MNRVIKVALAASAMLAISFTLSCSNDKDGQEKWCIVTETTNGITAKLCYKIGPTSTMFKDELACYLAGKAADAKVEDPPNRENCNVYDDGTGK